MLTGTLTMRGVGKEITVPVVAQTTPEGTRATSEFTINRHDWNISYKGMADGLIKDNVLIKLDLMFPLRRAPDVVERAPAEEPELAGAES